MALVEKNTALMRELDELVALGPARLKAALEPGASAEQFLRYDPALPGAAVFARAATWNRVANRLEPSLVRWKHLLKSRLIRAQPDRR